MSHVKRTIKNRIIQIATAVSVVVLGVSLPVFAAQPPTAKGNIGYSAYGLQRAADFKVQPDSNKCSTRWDLAGNYQIAFTLTGSSTPAVYSVTLKQHHSSVSGSATYPVGGPTAYAWKVTSGSVSGSNVSLSDTYTAGSDALSPLTKMTMTGTIAPGGTLSGTWSDNYQGGSRTGEWVTTSGNAVLKVVGCHGDGQFKYSDVDGNNYKVNVKYAIANGNDVWFAGPVTSGNIGAGNWLLAKVHDGGKNGNGDLISGSFTTKTAARLGVAQQANPGDGPFNVTSGDIAIK